MNSLKMDSENIDISIYQTCQEALETALTRFAKTKDLRERKALFQEYFPWIFFPLNKQIIVAASSEDLKNLLYLKKLNSKENNDNQKTN